MKRIIFILVAVALQMAYGQITEAASKGIKRDISAQTAQGENIYLYKDYHALVIGVGEYQHWPSLQFAARDAAEIAGRLESLGFMVTKVIDPTAAELRRALENLVYGPGREEDRGILIYFSGHGDTEKLADGSEMGYIVPVDAPLRKNDPSGFAGTAIEMKHIESAALRIRSKHVLMIFDSFFFRIVFQFAPKPSTGSQ